MRSQLLDILGIVQQSPPRLGRAPSRARSVGRNQAYIQLAGCVVPNSSIYTGCGETVEEEDGSSCGGAVLCIAERAAVGQDHGGGGVIACVVVLCGFGSIGGLSTDGSIILATQT